MTPNKPSPVGYVLCLLLLVIVVVGLVRYSKARDVPHLLNIENFNLHDPLSSSGFLVLDFTKEGMGVWDGVEIRFSGSTLYRYSFPKNP